MAFDINGAASSCWDDYKAIIEGDMPPTEDFLDILTKTLDDEFQNGTLSFANVDISTAKGTLVLPKVTNGYEMALLIGQAVSQYWMLTITPTGTAQNICTAVPSAIISVTNTAAAVAPIIQAGLLKIGTPYNESTPYFKQVIKVIIDAVKTIVWTVTELGQNPISGGTVPCPSVWTVTIS